MVTLGSSSMSKWVPFLVQEKLIKKEKTEPGLEECCYLVFFLLMIKLSVISQETPA